MDLMRKKEGKLQINLRMTHKPDNYDAVLQQKVIIVINNIHDNHIDIEDLLHEKRSVLWVLFFA